MGALLAAAVLIISFGFTVAAGSGGWDAAFATFYGDKGGGGTRQGACGYDDTVREGYGLETTALSAALFNDGRTCGACYEIRCHNSSWCQPGGVVVTVTATNFCPPNPAKPSSAGGWCNPPRKHFDLTEPMFLKIAEYKAGIVPVQFRRVRCARSGGMRFETKPNGNPNWIAVLVYNVAGAGDVKAVSIKGSRTGWIPMSRNWGQVWQTGESLLGQSLSFRVTAGDGRTVQSNDVAPPNWTIGQTFVGGQF